MRTVLGVDGGNTKTDYMLFDECGTFIRRIRQGTVSHEALPGGFRESGRLIGAHTRILLDEVGLEIGDISACAFGLAGLDTRSQHESMESVLNEMGFREYVAVNDGFLGLKAASAEGFGVCSICGTGTVAVGVDPLGGRLQVGGVGFICGDEGGAWHLARSVIRGVYDSLYRCGRRTEMEKSICELFDVEAPSYYIDRVIPRFHKQDITDQHVNQILFRAAENGDEVAISILEHSGVQMARSAAGCANHLAFGDKIEVVTAGAMWLKPPAEIMRNAFEREFMKHVKQDAQFIQLSLPPVCGAILWALELLHGRFPEAEIRAKVFSQIESLIKCSYSVLPPMI